MSTATKVIMGAGGGGGNAGEAVFTTTLSSKTHSWTVPDGVTSICALCIGAGAGATTRAGGGGALAWSNNIAVTPGETLSVLVSGETTSSSPSGSEIRRSGTSLIFAGGGRINADSTFTGDGGGKGRAGGGYLESYDGYYYDITSGGGGAAGGYTGDGAFANTNTGVNGSGAGGKTNVWIFDPNAWEGYGTTGGGAGGGTGIYGLGANGSGYGVAGSGGSGQTYGGGAGTYWNYSWSSQTGGPGVVRILWGDGRSFPSTSVDLASSNDNVTNYT